MAFALHNDFIFLGARSQKDRGRYFQFETSTICEYYTSGRQYICRSISGILKVNDFSATAESKKRCGSLTHHLFSSNDMTNKNYFPCPNKCLHISVHYFSTFSSITLKPKQLHSWHVEVRLRRGLCGFRPRKFRYKTSYPHISQKNQYHL